MTDAYRDFPATDVGPLSADARIAELRRLSEAAADETANSFQRAADEIAFQKAAADFVRSPLFAGLLSGHVSLSETLQRERDEALSALRECVVALTDLLGDTQHAGHDCGDGPENCPVRRARATAARLTGEGSE